VREYRRASQPRAAHKLARGIDPLSKKGTLIIAAYIANGGAAGIERPARQLPEEEVW